MIDSVKKPATPVDTTLRIFPPVPEEHKENLSFDLSQFSDRIQTTDTAINNTHAYHFEGPFYFLDSYYHLCTKIRIMTFSNSGHNKYTTGVVRPLTVQEGDVVYVEQLSTKTMNELIDGNCIIVYLGRQGLNIQKNTHDVIAFVVNLKNSYASWVSIQSIHNIVQPSNLSSDESINYTNYSLNDLKKQYFVPDALKRAQRKRKTSASSDTSQDERTSSEESTNKKKQKKQVTARAKPKPTTTSSSQPIPSLSNNMASSDLSAKLSTITETLNSLGQSLLEMRSQPKQQQQDTSNKQPPNEQPILKPQPQLSQPPSQQSHQQPHQQSHQQPQTSQPSQHSCMCPTCYSKPDNNDVHHHPSPMTCNTTNYMRTACHSHQQSCCQVLPSHHHSVPHHDAHCVTTPSICNQYNPQYCMYHHSSC